LQTGFEKLIKPPAVSAAGGFFMGWGALCFKRSGPQGAVYNENLAHARVSGTTEPSGDRLSG
jgi:hypothetical protein